MLFLVGFCYVVAAAVTALVCQFLCDGDDPDWGAPWLLPALLWPLWLLLLWLRRPSPPPARSRANALAQAHAWEAQAARARVDYEGMPHLTSSGHQLAFLLEYLAEELRVEFRLPTKQYEDENPELASAFVMAGRWDMDWF